MAEDLVTRAALVIDRVTALLALPRDAPIDEVLQALRIAFKRLADLELKAANDDSTSPTVERLDVRVSSLEERVRSLESKHRP